MEIKLMNEDKKKKILIFSIKGVSTAYVNALRRSIIDNVPVMAIDEVEFKKNNSILYDEMVAHRLGLIPLTTDLKSYNIKEECKCEGAGCARCTLKMILSEKGRKIVVSSELKSKDPKVKPAFDEIPIVKLLKGQDIEFEATARLGYGKEHAKFIPALAWFMQKPKLTINNNSNKLKEFKLLYPPQIFDKNGKIDKNLILTPNLVDAVEGICDDIIKVEYEENEFMFFIESWGQLEPKKVIEEAISRLGKKFEEFNKSLK